MIKFHIQYRRYFSLIFAVALAACQSPGQTPQPPVAPKSTTLTEIEALMASASKQVPTRPTIPTAVNKALLSAGQSDKASQADKNPRFNIDVVEAPIKDVLMGLVANTEENMVVHPAVSGNISLSLKDVSVDEVMQTLRDVYGYEYTQKGKTYRVYKPTLQTRIYHLNYINVTRNGYSQTNISAGGQASGRSSESNSSSGSSSQSSSSSSGSVIETNSKADLWKEIEESVLSIINRGAGRQVVVSPQSGAIVVRAMPDELRDVEAFLHSTQDTMHRQVILEAKIIEVELSDGFQAGINWAALGKDDGNTLLAGQTGGGTVFNNGLSDIAGNVGNLDPDAYSAVANAATSAFGGIFSAALQIDDFTAFIELLKSQGDVQVLSSPRVSTINNQKAVIKVGSDEYFVTEVSSGDISGTGNTDNQVPPDITLTPFFSGIALDVTPQIDVNHGVTLHIHPSVSNVVDQTKNITVNGQQQSLPLALSSVRESDSIVHAKSGQLIVIGGLMQNTTENQRGATPLLGDLPLVGALFRHTKKRYKKSELVILLRPIVVESVDNWNQSIRESSNTINAISTYKNHR